MDSTTLNTEIEKKYRITKEIEERIINSLNELRAENLGEDFEINTLYVNERLAKIQAAIRIRTIGDRNLLTFKRMVSSSGGLKTQIEHETEVADGDAMAKILEGLELSPSLVYEKRRKNFRLRETLVTLDELSFGLFMEIEGTLSKILEVEKLLRAHTFEPEPLTYPNLTVKMGVKIDGKFVARFD